VARNAFALALLATLTLGGCSFVERITGDKEAKEAEAKMVTLRVRTDSLRKARRVADSLAVVRHAACVDSVRADLSKPLVVKKVKAKRKKRSPAPSPELIATQAQQICEQSLGAPQTTIAANPSSLAPAGASNSVKPQPRANPAMSTTPVSATPVAEAPAAAVPPTTAAAPSAARTDSSSSPAPDAAADDSVRKAKDLEMSRETFAYSGAARDPFNSLLNMAKNGPELADLQLVGIYQNLRTPAANIAVFREKDGGKRHKLRAGDQVGRSRLVQIRERDVVFTIEDFGFERQETLSLRKQEDVAP
jgi:hypothetical protein